jgi:hypothetical protein
MKYKRIYCRISWHAICFSVGVYYWRKRPNMQSGRNATDTTRKNDGAGKQMTFFVEGLSIDSASVCRVRRIGEFQGLRDALLAAERIISEFLLREFKPGMPPDTLYSRYKIAGEVPYIFRDDGHITQNLPGFNHFQFAKSRCAEIAGAGTV